MKDLTHYFNSPKEEETDHNVSKSESHSEIVEEEAAPKKRKISLSKTKSKKKKSDSLEDKQLSPIKSNNVCEAQHKSKEPSSELVFIKNKKRKIVDESNSNSQKKIKTSKSLKIALKKCDSTINERQEVTETKQLKSNGKSNKSVVLQTEDKLCIVLEDSVSCDEPLTRPKRKSKKNLFLDSDDEIQSIENQSPLSTGKVENEKNANTSSRNSLFSYFNKVDKETALKQQNCGKIEVKAIVHLSPDGDKIERQSLEKRHRPNKLNKQKHKSQLDNSDTIEVISSEEVVYENSSTIVNVPMVTEQICESSSSSCVESVLNKPKPSNLASIFMPKKIGQHNENICSPTAEIDITQIGKNEKVHNEKLTKPSKQKKALSKSKKSLKPSEGLKSEKCSNKQSVDHTTEDNSSIRNTREKEIQVSSVDKKSTLKRNGFLKTSTIIEKNPPSNQKSHEEKKLHNVKSPRVLKSNKNLKNSDCKTQEKPKSTTNEEQTPKKQGLTINGFFTPKSNKLTSNNAVNSEKHPKSARSSWVMKVCLSSAIKKMNDNSEDDYQEDSQDSFKAEKETRPTRNSLEVSDDEIEDNIADPPVVVIDDENSSSDNKDDDDRRRRSLPRNAKKPKQKNMEEEEEDIEVKPQTQKPPVKIWPFFQKGGAHQPKKAPVDEEKLKAKMLFLESGVPEIIKRKVETVKSDLVLGSPAPFPTISHVMQVEEKTSCIGVERVGLHLPPARSVSPSPVLPAWTPLVSTDSPEDPEIPVFERPGNVKAFLEKLKEEETKTEIKTLYKKLKEYKSKAESDIWTEVYKPTNSADMVGNSENIKKLKTWLETLKNCRKREGSVSSGDEFVSEDSDGGDDSFNNMAMICGPCGCGKTSAVYAIAKELDIKVLEINASCNRSGKRILAEFSESTQSHHVERSQPINGIFNNQSSGKKKRKKSKTPNELKSEKTSLILVEDADLLFTDCDEGFVPSLASLAASSKRPIVLITNQAHTPHLDRFNNAKLLTLTFNRPRANKLSLWLRLIGLVEGVMMTPELALRLVTQSNCDVRRCLLQLQLMVHSNNSEVKEKLNPSSLWWGWPAGHKLSYELPTLLEPEEEETSPEADKKLFLRQLESVSETTRRLAHLDVLTLNSRTECLEDHEDPCPVAWRSKWRDSTALTVPSAPDLCFVPEANWLQQAITSRKDHSLGLSHRSGLTSQEAKWLSVLRQGEQLYMSGISVTAHTSHQSVTCDYLPALRELGRSEQVRLANYTRRANRFFNYLQGLGIHASKSYRDFMCDAFS